MKQQRKFMMNGKAFETLMAIARELGVKRVYAKDFAKLGIVEVTDSDAVVTTADAVVPADDVVVADEPASTEEVKADEDKPVVVEEQPAVEAVVDPEPEVVDEEQPAEDTPADEPNAVVEEQPAVVEEQPAVEPKKEKKAKKAKKEKPVNKATKASKPAKAEMAVGAVVTDYKGLGLLAVSKEIGSWSLEKLVELANALEVENLWEGIANVPIRKMRLIMEAKAIMFPGEKLPVEPSSPWKKISLVDLITLAHDNNLEYRHVNEERVQRMWVIKALNDAGLKPVVETKTTVTTAKVEDVPAPADEPEVVVADSEEE